VPVFFDRWRSISVDPSESVKTPSLVLHGQADPLVRVSQGWEYCSGLKMLGVPAEMVMYPGEPHGINELTHQEDLPRRVLDWCDQHLKK
jgi:dipeptidyl aminopeptidase/acylaminoacyl peptidase